MILENIIINIIIFAVLQFNVYKFLKVKKYIKKYINIIILFNIIAFTVSLIILNEYEIILYIIFYFVPIFFIYEGDITNKIFYTLFFYTIENLIISMVTIFLFMLIDTGMLTEVQILILINFVIITTVGLSQVLLFKFLNSKNFLLNWNSKKYKIYLILITISLLLISLIPLYIENYEDIENLKIVKNSILILIIFMVLIFIAYVYLIFSFYKERLIKKNLNQHVEIMALKNNLQEKKNLYEERAKLIHDIKNHNLIIKLLIEERKNEEALEYINQFNESVSKLTKIDFTNNLILNNILKLKMKKAIEKNITINVVCSVSYELNITSFDLTTLFGNLIDNAIEENERCINDAKFININIWEEGAFLFFLIENLTDKKALNDNEILRTKKINKKNGIGTKNIMRIVTRYNGNIVFKKKDNLFIVNGYLNNI